MSIPFEPTPTSFAEMARDFLDEEYADNPVGASALGIEGYDDQLDNLSESAFEDRRQRSEAWLTRFQELSPEGLSFDEQIDRDLVISVLRGRAIMADWEMWRRQPDTYLNPGMVGVFTLFLHRLKPEKEIARSAIGRLRAVPWNIYEGKFNLRPELMPRIYVDRAIGQARAGARYTREMLAGEVQDENLRGQLAEAGSIAADAFEDFARFLELQRDRSEGEWAIGEERYSRLLREKEMLDDDARSLRERGREEYARLAEQLRNCAQAYAQTDDWPRVLADLNKEHPRTPEEMRHEYETWTERARVFLEERGLVSFPEGEECAVVSSPHFQRPVLAVASYQSPPPFAPGTMKGHFFVPFPPDGAAEDDVQKRLEANSYSSIPTTSVHEAYPGHHWHLVTAKASERTSALRRTFRTPYFSEGWALYAERMMREQGFFTDPRHEMGQYEATIFRAARIVVDTSLHMGEMGYDEAVQFMMEKANLPEPTARAEVTRYCAWPTQASSYLTGCLEIVRIRERFFQQRGSTDTAALRTFHDTLCSSGGLPIALAERVALQGV